MMQQAEGRDGVVHDFILLTTYPIFDSKYYCYMRPNMFNIYCEAHLAETLSDNALFHYSLSVAKGAMEERDEIPAQEHRNLIIRSSNGHAMRNCRTTTSRQH